MMKIKKHASNHKPIPISLCFCHHILILTGAINLLHFVNHKVYSLETCYLSSRILVILLYLSVHWSLLDHNVTVCSQKEVSGSYIVRDCVTLKNLTAAIHGFSKPQICHACHVCPALDPVSCESPAAAVVGLSWQLGHIHLDLFLHIARGVVLRWVPHLEFNFTYISCGKDSLFLGTHSQSSGYAVPCMRSEGSSDCSWPSI